MQPIIQLLQKLFTVKFIWHFGFELKIISGVDVGEKIFYYVQKGSEKLKVFDNRVEFHKMDVKGSFKLVDTITKEEVEILHQIFSNPENFKR
jgi:hypothetical protein